jgi:cytochrome b561/polyisoprenoid-binding protein YceI
MTSELIEAAAGRSPRYTAVAIALHWAIALAILGMIALGWFMGDLPDSNPLKQGLYQLHKSIGITILTLTLARIGWRVMNPPPALPKAMKSWEKSLSHGVHVGFYALMVAMPLTGWLYVSTAHQFDVATVLFGAVSWPDIPFVGFLTNETGHDAVEFVHSKLAWVAIGLLVLHVGGAVKHDILDEEGVLKRMIPGLFGRTSPPAAPARGFLPAFGGAIAVFAIVACVPMLTGRTASPAPASAPLDGANWTPVAQASQIVFSGEHEGNRFEGRFEDWTASIAFDPDRLADSRVSVEVKTGSAKTGTKLYDDTLRQGEWFGVREFPMASVSLGDFAATDDGYTSMAEVTIKSASQTVPFDFNLDIAGDSATLQGRATLSRKALDIGQQSDPGADWVSDAITIEVRLEAVRKTGD